MAKPKPPTKAMYAAIGHVASESTHVEEMLRELYCYLIDSPYGRIVTAGEDMSNLCNSCLRVAKYNRRLSNSQVEELFALVKDLRKFSLWRNSLIHARWEKLSLPGKHVGIGSNRATTNKTGKGIEELSIVHVDDVENLARNFLHIAQEIETFIEKTFDREPFDFLVSRNDLARFDNLLSGRLRSRTSSDDH